MTEKELTVSAIVPVYNEARTVAGVLEVLLTCPQIDEIIVVNDGSTDSTQKILRSFGSDIRLVDQKINKGKGHALAAGIRKAKGDIVFFCDADFVNLSSRHVKWMLDPVLSGVTRVVLGYPVRMRYVPPLLSHLTGERVYFREDLLPHLNAMQKSRFGVEVLLNDLFKNRHLLKVPLPGLKGLYKYEKQNTDTALKEYYNEVGEIARELGRLFKLRSGDLKIIQELTKTRDISEIFARIQEIGNTDLRLLLEKYLAEHFKKVRKWLPGNG